MFEIDFDQLGPDYDLSGVNITLTTDSLRFWSWSPDGDELFISVMPEDLGRLADVFRSLADQVDPEQIVDNLLREVSGP